MANRGVVNGMGTNGSQFFITYTETSYLDGLNSDGSPKNCGMPGNSCHSVFGKVSKGMEVVNGISPRDPQSSAQPGDVMKSVTIQES